LNRFQYQKKRTGPPYWVALHSANSIPISVFTFHKKRRFFALKALFCSDFRLADVGSPMTLRVTSGASILHAGVTLKAAKTGKTLDVYCSTKVESAITNPY
jgi:hypothetical protein